MTRWQVWWELNKDAYLRNPALAIDPRRSQPARAAIPVRQKLEVILPALKKAMDSTSNQDLTSGCLIALGKIGLDHPDFKILDEFRQRLRRGNQEIREVAALAMGIAKQPAAIDDLAALLQDTAKGRTLVGKEKVDDRTRSFAAYGLGLIARGNDDVEVKTRVFDALRPLLEDREMRDPDILIGVLNGMRLIDPKPGDGALHRRLLWTCLQCLEAYQERPFSKSRQAILAHVPPAIARLLGRHTAADHTRVKAAYARQLRGRKRWHQTFYQSGAIALGQLLVAPEDHPGDAEALAVLHHLYDTNRDQLTRHFALIAMGQIGGKTNLDRLVKELKHGKRDQQAWAALALGLLVFHAPQDPAPSGQATPAAARLGATVGALLHRALLNTNDRDIRAALALALGLCKYQPAAPDLRKLLQKYRRIEEFAGYLCMGLALMDDKLAGDLIDGVMADAARRPMLMTQAALALARLRHPNASATLYRVLQASTSLRILTLASVSHALGHLADPANVGPLVAILTGPGNNSLVRAFAAVSLGSMAENDSLTWSAWVAMNMNYTATVSTLTNGGSGILDIL